MNGIVAGEPAGTVDATLSPIEAARLVTLEAVIDAGLQTAFDVGDALGEIRELRLYRATHATMEDYCRDRWSMSKRHANRMIAAAEVAVNLGPVGPIPTGERQARPLTILEPDAQREAWQIAVDTAPEGKITAAHVQATVNQYRAAVNVEDAWGHVETTRPLPLTAANHAPSADPDYDGDEWYTPEDIIKRARRVFGGCIDLDPATNEIAQRVINATDYYTKADDGLNQPWRGRVWLNPPYSMPLIVNFVDRVLAAYAAGEIDEAIVLTNNSSDTRWFQSLISNHVVCFPAGRLGFWRNNQQAFAARQGQAIFYLGQNRPRFIEAFAEVGTIAEAI